MAPATALAAMQTNGWGPRLGFSVNPDQFVIGGQFLAGEIAPNIDLVPNLELGFGDHATVIQGNLDLHYRFQLAHSPWTPYAGAGMGVAWFDFSDNGNDSSDTNFGGQFIGGASVPTKSGNKFFAEMRLGLGDVPDWKFLVGWNFMK
jgi:hypothetical protein